MREKGIGFSGSTLHCRSNSDRKVASELLQIKTLANNANSQMIWPFGPKWNHVHLKIEGFSIDTRKIDKGGVVAIKDQRDGHEFLEVAEQDGAGGAFSFFS